MQHKGFHHRDTKSTEVPPKNGNHEGTGENNRGRDESRKVIGLAIKVHRHPGPGLLERAYEEWLSFELRQAGVPHARQQKLPVRCGGVELDCRYAMDLVIEKCMVVEVKSIDRILPLHEAQMMTYLRLSGHSIGLLMNFDTPVLKDGSVRRVF